MNSDPIRIRIHNDVRPVKRESFYLEAKAGVELVNSGGLLVGEAADDKDDHCAHSALVVPTQVRELKQKVVAGENVRASREKSGNHPLANLPTCSYKYVYVTLCIQSCRILRGINILSSTRVSFF
jgi:hypothetical protein